MGPLVHQKQYGGDRRLDFVELKVMSELCPRVRRVPQRDALFQAYRKSTNTYTKLLKQLRSLQGSIDSEYTVVNSQVELAKQKMIADRDNLNLHLAMHQCHA
jgi:hypothetical protein